MEEISSIYWMIVFGFVSSFVCLVLLYIALLLKESKDTIKESRMIVQESKKTVLKLGKMVDELEGMVSVARGTVEEVSNSILKPIRAISGIVGTIDTLLVNKKEKKKENVTIEDLLNE